MSAEVQTNTVPDTCPKCGQLIDYIFDDFEVALYRIAHIDGQGNQSSCWVKRSDLQNVSRGEETK